MLFRSVSQSRYAVDIDYFKQYNDTYGHDMGDETLKKIANTLKDYFSKKYEFVFRLGGEEFGVVLFDTNENILENCLKTMNSRVLELQIDRLKQQIDSFYFGNLIPIVKLQIITDNFQEIISCKKVKQNCEFKAEQEAIFQEWEYYFKSYKNPEERIVVDTINEEIILFSSTGDKTYTSSSSVCPWYPWYCSSSIILFQTIHSPLRNICPSLNLGNLTSSQCQEEGSYSLLPLSAKIKRKTKANKRNNRVETKVKKHLSPDLITINVPQILSSYILLLN